MNPACPFCDLTIPEGEETLAESPYTGNPVPCCKSCVDEARKQSDAIHAEQERDYARGISLGAGVGR
jgi:hypothetical protein